MIRETGRKINRRDETKYDIDMQKKRLAGRFLPIERIQGVAHIFLIDFSARTCYISIESGGPTLVVR